MGQIRPLLYFLYTAEHRGQTMELLMKNIHMCRRAKQVEKQQLLLEREELTFQKSVQLLRMNYILLRLAKKMKAEQAQKSKDNDSGDLGLWLDEEEEQALSELMRNGKKEE